MRFFLDHDVPEEVAWVLEERGLDLVRSREVLPRTTPDPLVWREVQKRGCIFITCNRNDFLSLAASGHHAGLIIVIRRPRRGQEAPRFRRLLLKAGEVGLAGNINYA